MQYDWGQAANIVDANGTVVGAVKLSNLPYKIQEQPAPPAVGSAAWWSLLQSQLQLFANTAPQEWRNSFNKPWHKMTWSEWWSNL